MTCLTARRDALYLGVYGDRTGAGHIVNIQGLTGDQEGS